MKELMGSNKRDKKKGFYPLVPVYLERFSIILSCLLSPQLSRDPLVCGFISSAVSTRITLKQDYIGFLDFDAFLHVFCFHLSLPLLGNSILVMSYIYVKASNIISLVVQRTRITFCQFSFEAGASVMILIKCICNMLHCFQFDSLRHIANNNETWRWKERDASRYDFFNAVLWHAISPM